jgi:single-strand DNA-binding protein
MGGDPVAKQTDGGKDVCSFNVCSNHKFRNSSGEPKEDKLWVRVTAWGQLADVCQRMGQKGAVVLVEGSLKPDEKGNPRVYDGVNGPTASFELTANTVRFISNYKSFDGSPEPEGTQDDEF